MITSLVLVLLFYSCRHPTLLLSATVSEENSLFSDDLNKVDSACYGEVMIPRGTVHVTRSKPLWRVAYYERLTISSYDLSPISIPFFFFLIPGPPRISPLFPTQPPSQ